MSDLFQSLKDAFEGPVGYVLDPAPVRVPDLLPPGDVTAAIFAAVDEEARECLS